MINLRTYNLDALNKDKHYKIMSKLQHDPQSCKYISKILPNGYPQKNQLLKISLKLVPLTF